MHLALVLATIFALYPVLWVVSLALSSHHAPVPAALPVPTDPSLANLRDVISTGTFGRQLANSLIVSLATAGVGCALAIPAGYALARFDFVGKAGGTAVLMAIRGPGSWSATRRLRCRSRSSSSAARSRRSRRTSRKRP